MKLFFRQSPKWKYRLGSIGLVLASLFLYVLAGWNPALVESWYSRGVFPPIGRGLAWVNKFFTFSLAEVLLILLGLSGLGGLLWFGRQVYLKRLQPRAIMKSLFWNGMTVLGIGLLGFQLIWGLNYSRLPLIKSLHFQEKLPTQADLETLSQQLICQTNQNFNLTQVTSTFPSGSRMPFSRQELYRELETVYQQQTWLGSAAPGGFGPPKPVWASGWMSRCGISGVYFPFTGEANYNALIPDCELPFTMAHEMAHQRGLAFEDEANFMAFLICTRSKNPYCQYSGYLLGALYVLSSLTNPSQDLMTCFEPGPKSDLTAMFAFWAHYQGSLSDLSKIINDTYLKMNGVTAGVENYGQVTLLIFAYYTTSSPYLTSNLSDKLKPAFWCERDGPLCKNKKTGKRKPSSLEQTQDSYQKNSLIKKCATSVL